MSGRLAGNVRLSSGTARRHGEAAARRFAAEGATVGGGDILDGDGVPRLDVTDERSVAGWIEGAVAEHGRIDVRYNNAGAVRFGPVDEQPFADWRSTPAAELESCSSPASMRVRTCAPAAA